MKARQAKREVTEARVTELQGIERDLRADADAVERLRSTWGDWTGALGADPILARQVLRKVLGAPIYVWPGGSRGDRAWGYAGVSRLDGVLRGGVANGEAVVRYGPIIRTPISGGCDALVRSRLSDNDMAPPHPPGARPAPAEPWRSSTTGFVRSWCAPKRPASDRARGGRVCSDSRPEWPTRAARGGCRATHDDRVASRTARPGDGRLGLRQQPVAVHLRPPPLAGGRPRSRRSDPRPAHRLGSWVPRRRGAVVLRGPDGAGARVPRPRLLATTAWSRMAPAAERIGRSRRGHEFVEAAPRRLNREGEP